MRLCEECKHSRKLTLTGIRICTIKPNHPDCNTIKECKDAPETNFQRFIRQLTPESLAEMISGEYNIANNPCKCCTEQKKRICNSRECAEHIKAWLESGKE